MLEAGSDSQVLSPDGASQDDAGLLHLNPLCGNADSKCLPDSPQSCSQFTPPPVPGADASSGDDAATPAADSGRGGGSSATGGSTGSGAASSSSSDASGAGGASEAAGAAGARGAAGSAGMSAAAGAAGAAGASPSNDSAGAAGMTAAAAGAGAGGGSVAPPPAYGCQVRRIEGAPKSVIAECSVAGPGGANSPCFSANDCQAGFGCVGDQNAGLCQQYCCQGGDLCRKGTYCAVRPLRDATVNALPRTATDSPSRLSIPVCVPAENCDLGTPYPCAAGTACACQSGTACMVVRSDGTTTCAVPGIGKAGDACPCAWGHVCSAATNQCLKLCFTRDATSCGDGKCQSSSELPSGWGVCVGST